MTTFATEGTLPAGRPAAGFDPARIRMPMPIRTPRLLIRSVMPGDGAEMAAAKRETLDRLNPWLPFAAHAPDDTENETTAREFYDKFLRREDAMLVGIEHATGRLVAWGGLHFVSWPERIFSSGYWVRRSAHGKGYATEMNNAILRYAFCVLNARRMEIFHADGNIASESVIRRLGYTYEGTGPGESHLNNGAIVPRHRYARANIENLPELNVKW